jgi:hypothetical protein
MVKTSKRDKRYFLALVPGDARVDRPALKEVGLPVAPFLEGRRP